MPHDEPASDPAAWLGIARGDLRVAESASDAHPSDSIALGLCCFHCQQAAEKAFKAVLVSRGIEFPKSHDLEFLIAEVEGKGGIVVPEAVQQAVQLNEFIVESRYPDSVPVASWDVYHEASLLAQAVVDWAQQVVAAPPLSLDE